MKNNRDKTKRSKQDFAYTSIIDSIIREEYAPNQMIFTRDLCAKLGVSRTPVTEALKKLSYEGFVELIPNRGVTVTSVRPSDLIELYQLREGLEGVAARICAQNQPAEIVEQMGQCLDQYDEAFRNEQYGKAIKLDNLFHTLLIAGSGNERMIQFMELITHQSGRGNFLQGRVLDRMKRSAGQHRKTLNAIRKRDPDLAEKRAQEHVRDIQRFVLSYEKSHDL